MLEGHSYWRNNSRSQLWFKVLDWSEGLSVFLLAYILYSFNLALLALLRTLCTV